MIQDSKTRETLMNQRFSFFTPLELLAPEIQGESLVFYNT